LFIELVFFVIPWKFRYHLTGASVALKITVIQVMTDVRPAKPAPVVNEADPSC